MKFSVKGWIFFQWNYLTEKIFHKREFASKVYFLLLVFFFTLTIGWWRSLSKYLFLYSLFVCPLARNICQFLDNNSLFVVVRHRFFFVKKTNIFCAKTLYF